MYWATAALMQLGPRGAARQWRPPSPMYRVVAAKQPSSGCDSLTLTERDVARDGDSVTVSQSLHTLCGMSRVEDNFVDSLDSSRVGK